jgi:hypothetical protein
VEAALIALQNIATLERLLFLFGGVLMGLAPGAMPGVGGLVGLATLLPFTFDMDPYAASRPYSAGQSSDRRAMRCRSIPHMSSLKACSHRRSS